MMKNLNYLVNLKIYLNKGTYKKVSFLFFVDAFLNDNTYYLSIMKNISFVIYV